MWTAEAKPTPKESAKWQIGQDFIRIHHYDCVTDDVMVQGYLAGILFTESTPGPIDVAKSVCVNLLRDTLYRALKSLEKFEQSLVPK